jgi:hypothetical protein
MAANDFNRRFRDKILKLKDLLLTKRTNLWQDMFMARDVDSVKAAARRLASLIQGHMDAEGLTASQREKNVRALERATAKIGGSREKSEVRLGNARGRRVAASR